MNADLDVSFAPRTIAQARTRRAHAFSRLLRIALRKVQAGLRVFWTRLARTSRYHHELDLLMHADDRMLADIGLTRFDVVSAAQESRGWYGRRDALRAAATRRDDAIGVARARRSRLPEMPAPPVVPALPCTMETSSFR